MTMVEYLALIKTRKMRTNSSISASKKVILPKDGEFFTLMDFQNHSRLEI
jgi:hypothetical protein